MNKVPIKGTLSYLQLICAWGDVLGLEMGRVHLLIGATFLQSPEIRETWTDPGSLLESIFGK